MVAGPQALESSSIAFPCTLVGSQVGNRMARTLTCSGIWNVSFPTGCATINIKAVVKIDLEILSGENLESPGCFD